MTWSRACQPGPGGVNSRMRRFWPWRRPSANAPAPQLRRVQVHAIDRGRPPVYTLYALLLPLLLLYLPAWFWSASEYVSLALGLALVPVTLLAVLFAYLALSRHERWRWVGVVVLVLNLTVFFTVVRQP